MAKRSAESGVTRGTKNVFADLGYPDAAERQAKLRLAYALNRVLDQRDMTQTAAAAVLGLSQPKVSALRNYKLGGFSVERLMTLLNALDQDVEIVITQKRSAHRPAAVTVGSSHPAGRGRRVVKRTVHARELRSTQSSGQTELKSLLALLSSDPSAVEQLRRLLGPAPSTQQLGMDIRPLLWNAETTRQAIWDPRSSITSPTQAVRSSTTPSRATGSRAA